jgi:hypothetical protein
MTTHHEEQKKLAEKKAAIFYAFSIDHPIEFFNQCEQRWDVYHNLSAPKLTDDPLEWRPQPRPKKTTIPTFLYK